MKAEEISQTKSHIRGKRILITGTTGFLGKVLLEKIIRDIPDVGHISLLIRGNSQCPTAEERFWSEVYNSSVFDRLKAQDKAWFDHFCRQKIRCITGEITFERFGLSDAEYKQLARETDIVVNSAASVNFREALDKALQINTLCLNNTVAFVAVAGNIPVVQISTCYVNGFNTGDMYETLVEPAGEPIARDANGAYRIDRLIDSLLDKVERIKRQYDDPGRVSEALVDLGIKEANRYGWNDTYTFTKWLGEQLLIKALQGKTLTILRPSVVESALEEPVPGWIEGVKVVDSIVLAFARSRISYFPARPAGVVDIIPVDLVANSILLGMAETFMAPDKTRIYQCCSGSDNPLGVARYIDLITTEVKTNWKKYNRLTRKKPSKDFIPVNKTLFLAAMRGLKAVMLLVDRISFRSTSNKSNRLKNIETALKLSSVYAFYTNPHYVFHNEKLTELADRMGELDKMIFPVDVKKIDWDHYFRKVHLAGLNNYGMEDRTGTMVTAKMAVDRASETTV